MTTRHFNSDGWSFEPLNSPKAIDLTDQRFTRLTVIQFYGVRSHQNGRTGSITHWICKCDCGKEAIVSTPRLHRGESKSCGCLGRENNIASHTTHGYCKKNTQHRRFPPEYNSWSSMLERTTNPNNHAYYRYGAIGRVACQAIRESFEYFLKIVGHKPFPRAQLDRANNDGGYTCGACGDCKSNNWPMNLRWVTAKQNSNNRRDTKFLTFNGETKPLRVWAEELNIPGDLISHRLRDGFSVERALTFPRRAKKPNGNRQ